MREGEWSKSISVWWNTSPEEWFLPLGYHQWLMWEWLSQDSPYGSHCFYLPQMDEKNSLCSGKKISFSGVHVPLSKCCYPQNQDGRICVSMSVIPLDSLVQGWFCLCTRWWGETAEGYSSTLLYAPKHCLLGLTDYVAEARTCVVWTGGHSNPTASSHNKIFLGVGLEYLGYKMCWSVDSWNRCSF